MMLASGTIACAFVLAISVASGAGQPVLLDSMEDPSLYTPAQPEPGHRWTGSVSLETADYQEGAGCLRFEVQSARSKEESYPQWGRAFDPAQTDWTGYSALRYWVKVTSSDPTVTRKAMCVVVYNGNSPLQQFERHVVPVGQWVQLTDNIASYNRDRVRGIVIYLYETDPTRMDSYTWWVDGMELVPREPGQMDFDGTLVHPATQPEQHPTYQVASEGGPALIFDAGGRIVQLRHDHQVLWDADGQVPEHSGLMIFDRLQDRGPRPVTGTVIPQDGGLLQSATTDHGLQVQATFRPTDDRLDAQVDVTDTTGMDRPLTLYFAVPLDARGWTWWDDIRTPRTIGGQQDFWYTPWYPLKPRWSGYPLCCVSNETAALSLAVPMVPPRIQRTVYDPRLKLLYIAFDFCLTPAAVKQHQSARFRFSLYGCDPTWGFRSAVRRYYAYHPDDFVKRIPRDGGWGCWGTFEGNPDIPDLGFQYHWGPDARGGISPAHSVRYDNEHGYFSFPYIEWTNMHLSMEGYESAGSREIMERVRMIADPERTEPLPEWSYWFPYDERLGPDRDQWMRRVFQAYLQSLIFDQDGQVYGRADRSEFGILAAKYIPFNADPDIPGGAGDFFLNTWWPLIEKYYVDHGARIDGFGWDNFYVGGCALDYRREHFAHADEPLTFDPVTLQPAILKDMSTWELQDVLTRKLRGMGRYLIANQGAVSMVTATLSRLDIFGYEWNIRNAETYARTMAWHKPVCSLPLAPEHYQDPFVRDHLLYGCWPGGYYDTRLPQYVELMRTYVPIIRRQSAAGWEPVTLARADDAAVQVERFGGGERELLFSLRNHAAADKRVRVTIMPGALREGVTYRATELVSGQSLGELSADGRPEFAVDAPAGQVIVVAVEPVG